MKEVYVVCFKVYRKDKIVTDSVFKNREDAEDYVNKWNEWEESERGQNDLWFINPVEYHETRVEV
jgi:hypothetical protein